MSKFPSLFHGVMPLGKLRNPEKFERIRLVLGCTFEKVRAELEAENIDATSEALVWAHATELASRLGIMNPVLLSTKLIDTTKEWPNFTWSIDEDLGELHFDGGDFNHFLAFVESFVESFEAYADSIGEPLGLVSGMHRRWDTSSPKSEVRFGFLRRSFSHELPPPPPTSTVPKGRLAQEAFVRNYQRDGETYGDTLQRISQAMTLAVGPIVQRIGLMAECVCDTHRFPGVILGTDRHDNKEYGWVGACKQCQTFASDDHAAFFVARALGLEIGYALPHGVIPRPYLKGLTFEEVQALNTQKRK